MGFRPALSSQDSLAVVYHDIYKDKLTAIRKVLVVLDIKKTFESVPQEVVIESARGYELSGRTLNFITSFLEGRECEIAIGK